MRNNLTKKDIVKSIYMQIGFPKKVIEEIINDLIIAAYNNAKENLKKKSSEEISKITGGINLPFDIKFPK